MSKPIRVVADPFIYELESFLGKEVSLSSVESSSIFESITPETQAVLIRTVSKTDAQIVAHFPDSLQFLATASAGFDHVDRKALQKRTIRFAYAAGCNARAVAEYVLTALLIWADKNQINILEKSLGIIGVGHVGRAVHRLAKKIGMNTLLYDPPREKRSKTFRSCNSNDLKSADIITFHTPLDETTRHLFSSSTFGNVTFDLVINAARGGVVDEAFLLKQKQAGLIQDFILDCWENEPNITPEMVKHAFIATPHIAGYSEQAKLKATSMITNALHRTFSILPFQVEKPVFPQEMVLDSTASLSELLSKIHPILEYDGALRALITQPKSEHKQLFNHVRNSRVFRTEYAFIRLHKNWLKRFPILNHLGVKSTR